MARMMTNARRDRAGQQECVFGCCTVPGRYTHGGRKNPKFRKSARAAEKAAVRKEIRGI